MRSFIEAMGTDEAEPTEEHHCDFDLDAVEAAFGEQGLSSTDRDKLARALAFILDWLLKVDLSRHDALKSIGRRAVAMAWVLDPERFKCGNKLQSPSLTSLARQLGMTAANLSPDAADFSRITSLSNRFQGHDWKNKKGTSPHDIRNN